MFSKNKTRIYTDDYWDSIERAAKLMRNAEYVLVGIGSGATSAGGLCYTDFALAKKWHPEYFAAGKESIVEIMGDPWPTTINEDNAATFWGFWVKHIYHIRYEAWVLRSYSDLFQILRGKQFFVATTNVDGQLEKAGFDKWDIFAPQGDYALLQCALPCSQDVYDNKAAILFIYENMAKPFEIHASDIPRCPRCGKLSLPNLRCGVNFAKMFVIMVKSTTQIADI